MPRQAHLPAVGVTGQHERGPVVGHRVQHPPVGGVGDAQTQVAPVAALSGARLRRGHPVPPDVGVVHPDQADGPPGHLQPGPGVGEVEPPGPGQRRDQVTGRQVDHGAVDAAGAEEVPQRAAHRRRVVVVRAQHESPRAVQQVTQRAHHGGHGIAVGEHVPGHDRQVGLERREAGHPVPLRRAAGPQVEVGQVEQPERGLTRGEHGHLHPTQDRAAGLHERPAQHRRPGHDRSAEQTARPGPGGAHPWSRPPSSSATSSAISAVLSAAPLRRLSPHTNRSSVRGKSSACRIRPT